MSILGIRLTMGIGEKDPLPAPLKLNEALQSVEVTHNDEGRSGFQLTLQIGRSALDLFDYSLLKDSKLKPFNRVLLSVYFNVTRHPLMDGIITKQQLSPSNDPGASILTITGEDVGVMMDLEKGEREDVSVGDENQIVRSIIKKPEYGDYGFVRDTIANRDVLINPPSSPPNPQENGRTQPQHSTDWDFITELASRYGYVFYVRPSKIPKSNLVYWGKPVRSGPAQEALLVNMGPHTNVESISFQYNALAPAKVKYVGNESSGTQETGSRAALVETPAELRRTEFLGDSRLDDKQIKARAIGMVDKSMDGVVTASGELDALRYGRMLEPRALVTLAGVGHSYDGEYYVKSVTHKLNVREGQYKQSFTLTREGVGATLKFFGL